ncbi:MAG: hypothetical protein L0H23_09685, partial [Luteimonas sp.]|nr:hypothetical protein [Luteimonas sp.]
DAGDKQGGQRRSVGSSVVAEVNLAPLISCEARNNRVRDLSVAGGGSATGIQAVADRLRIDGNYLSQGALTGGGGIDAYSSSNTVCTNNVVINYSAAYNFCTVSTNNVELPTP